MSVFSIDGASYPTFKNLKDMFLRTIQYEYERRGIVANVLPGSAYDIQATAFAEQMSIAIANNEFALQQMTPTSAIDDNLTDICGVFGIYKRDAARGSGYVTVEFSGSSASIPQGYQCTASDGSKYAVSALTNLTVSPGDVLVDSIEGGEAVNKNAGHQMTWDSNTIGNLDPICVVATGGITGGADADDNDRLRARLFDKLRASGVNGSWSKFKEWAEESSSAVQQAFVYSAVRGPGSLDIAIMDNDGNRELPSNIVNTVAAYVDSKYPGYADVNVTTVDAVEVDVTLAASLPSPIAAGGSGSGWTDTNPWPDFDCYVTASSGTITVTYRAGTSSSPVVGNKIAIWDPDGERFYRYSIESFTHPTGTTWVLTVKPQLGNGGNPGAAIDHTGAYVSADATNLEAYVEDFLLAMSTLGPGEKTTNQDLLPRAARKPAVDSAYPSNLTTALVAPVITGNPEVLDMAYGVRLASGTGTTMTSPAEPASTLEPPKILILNHFAIRKL